MRLIIRYFAAFTITLGVFGSGLFGGVVIANEGILSKADPYSGLYGFSLNLHRIQNEYVELKETEELMHYAIQGMVNGLDDHSKYFPPDEFKKIQSKTTQWSVGAGITINSNKVITNILPQGPASIAGLMVGDRILSINERDIEDWSVGNVYHELQLGKGTRVAVSAIRNNVTVQANVILDDVPQLLFSMQSPAPGNIYIHIQRFGVGLVDDIASKLNKQESVDEQPIKGIIIDLRNNPGGNVLEGIAFADLFMDDGLISEIQYRHKDENQRHSATSNERDRLTPNIAILINNQTASAAELVAGSLQQRANVKVIGDSSFGKGTVQKMYTSESEALKLTVGTFTAGNQVVSIDHPIQPDIVVSQLKNDYKQTALTILESTAAKDNTELYQNIKMLRNPIVKPIIPWHLDFFERTKLDPQLMSAWDTIQ